MVPWEGLVSQNVQKLRKVRVNNTFSEMLRERAYLPAEKVTEQGERGKEHEREKLFISCNILMQKISIL